MVVHRGPRVYGLNLYTSLLCGCLFVIVTINVKKAEPIGLI